MIKNIAIQWNIQGNSAFQGKRKLLKKSECKKYIQYSENFQGKSFFTANAKFLKNPEW